VENAFNSISREAILEKVKRTCPELEGWFRFCYGKPAKLFCEGEVLPFGSGMGVQQGDPLGPFLFALGISGCCTRLKSELDRETLSVWYLDDGTLVGREEEVARGWKIIQEEMKKVGLRVNVEKCEVWEKKPSSLSALEGIPRVKGDGIELLGAPIGTTSFCDNFVKKRVHKIKHALEALGVIDDPQVELQLIRSCLGFPRLAFALRTAPPRDISGAIDEFDELIEQVCADRLGLEMTPEQKRQWHLPVSLGGVGMVQAKDVAESAFVGSVAQTRKLVAQLLGTEETWDVAGVKETYESLRNKVAEVEQLPPSIEELPSASCMKSAGAIKHPQFALSELAHRANRARLLANCSSSREKLRLDAVAREGAGAWLQAVPCAAVGMKFDRDEFLVLLKWWLGMNVLPDGGRKCPEGGGGKMCGESLDPLGDHAVMCGYGPSRTARHDAVNEKWATQLRAFGFHVQLEVRTDPETRRRSADTWVENWKEGRGAAHDWVVTHVWQKEAEERGKTDPNWAVEKAEAYKELGAKEDVERRGMLFVPMAADTFGGFGVAAREAVRQAVARGRIFEGNALSDRYATQKGVLQSLQVGVMRGIARQLLRRLVPVEEA